MKKIKILYSQDKTVKLVKNELLRYDLYTLENNKFVYKHSTFGKRLAQNVLFDYKKTNPINERINIRFTISKNIEKTKKMLIICNAVSFNLDNLYSISLNVAYKYYPTGSLKNVVTK